MVRCSPIAPRHGVRAESHPTALSVHDALPAAKRCAARPPLHLRCSACTNPFCLLGASRVRAAMKTNC